MRVVRLFAILAGLILTMGHGAVAAEDFPSRPVSLVVPYSPGGPYDILARFVSESARKLFPGKTMLVESKGGGNTLVGIQAVLQAPADGYTLLISTLPITSNLLLLKNPGYKADDFIPVAPVARHPYLFFVPASLPVSNLAELVAYAEKNPGKLNIGALSPGGQVQLLADRFLRASKLKIEKIPYKGAAELAKALLTGDIQMSFFAYSAGAPFLKDGRVKAIAIATDERSALTPDIPTFKEQGMAGVTGESWVALFARANTPKDTLVKLREMLVKIGKDPDYRAQIKAAGNESWDIAPDKMADYIKADTKQWEPDFALIEKQ
jgi:tripartite-type tricarboxylate transporter receptor subunit TctC